MSPLSKYSAPNELTKKVAEGLQKKVKNTADVLNLDPETPLEDLHNSLEFLLVTLSQAFSLKPVAAAGLLTNNNKFLKSACLKGVKNQGYEPLVNWYKKVYENCSLLVELMLSEFEQFGSKSFLDILKTLASGLLSNDSSIVNFSFMVLIRCFKEISSYQNDKIELIVYNWVTAKHQQSDGEIILIQAILQAMKTHNQIASFNTVELFDSLGILRNKITQLYR